MKKTILIDIDDTIENLCGAWVDWLNREYGTSVDYTQITQWDISKFFPNLTKEQVYEPLHNPHLWEYVQPKDGAVEYVKKLIDDGYNVYLCTTTDYRNVKPKFESVIQKHFPYISWNQVIVIDKKQMVKADALIDDGVHNLAGGDYIKILVSAPHNMAFNAPENGMYRVNNWKEIYSLVHRLLDNQPKKCSFREGVSIRPDGVHELEPHAYQETQIIHNATVSILKCKNCGKESVGWLRQPNSYEDDNLFVEEE